MSTRSEIIGLIQVESWRLSVEPFSDKNVGAMKATFVRWFLIGMLLLLAVIAIDSNSEEARLGIRFNWVNGDYSFSGGSPPWILAFAAVNIALYGLLFASEGNASSRPMPHLFRRFLAGLVDWMLSFSSSLSARPNRSSD